MIELCGAGWRSITSVSGENVEPTSLLTTYSYLFFCSLISEVQLHL